MGSVKMLSQMFWGLYKHSCCGLIIKTSLPPHRAYSLYNPEVGYCQGMGFITALMLCYMPEEVCHYENFSAFSLSLFF